MNKAAGPGVALLHAGAVVLLRPHPGISQLLVNLGIACLCTCTRAGAVSRHASVHVSRSARTLGRLPAGGRGIAAAAAASGGGVA